MGTGGGNENDPPHYTRGGSRRAFCFSMTASNRRLSRSSSENALSPILQPASVKDSNIDTQPDPPRATQPAYSVCQSNGAGVIGQLASPATFKAPCPPPPSLPKLVVVDTKKFAASVPVTFASITSVAPTTIRRLSW